MLTLAIFSMGGPELVVIMVIALLVFGTRLPAVMRSAGQSVNAFKQGLAEVTDVEPAEVPAEPRRHHA